MKKVLLSALFLGLVGFASSSFAWQPSKDIEFVVPSSPGGGSDVNARTIADMAKGANLTSSAFMVVNRPAGSGASAFSYVAGKKGDNHTLMVLHSGQELGSYVNNWDVKANDLTYLGTVAFDAQLLCARADSDIKDLKTAVEKSKKGRVTYGGSHKGNTDHLSYILLNRDTGSDFKYVRFNSSGEALTALLGKHVDLAVLNPSEALAQIEAGKVIPLFTFSFKRDGGELANVPTIGELGYPNSAFTDARSIAGPPDMDPEAIKFYEDMLKKITDLPRWDAEYIKRNFLTPMYMNAEDTKNYYKKVSAEAIEGFKLEK